MSAARNYALRVLPALLQLGTMWGIFEKEEADRIIPEGHRRPHFK